MTSINYPEALRRLLVHEGGYSNDAADPGGPTKYGITIIDYRKYINPAGTAADVKAMTVEQAKVIYDQRYARPLHFDVQPAAQELPSGVDYAVFDYGVNSGISRAAKILQRLCGVTEDGVIGPETLSAAARRNPVELIHAICDERMRFLKGLRIWSVFGKGWTRRVSEVRKAAVAMANRTPPDAQPPLVSSIPASGKGAVTPPKVAVPTAAGGTAATAAAGFAGWDWITAHPTETALMAGGLILAGTSAYMAFKRWNEATFAIRQEAVPVDLNPLPTPIEGAPS